MSGLVHISKYINEIREEINTYDKELTARAEAVSANVKIIQEELGKLKVPMFSYWWSVDEEGSGCSFSVGLHWTGSKVTFLFEDHDPEVLLGANRDIRVSTQKYLTPFLEEGLKQLKSRTASLDL